MRRTGYSPLVQLDNSGSTAIPNPTTMHAIPANALAKAQSTLLCGLMPIKAYPNPIKSSPTTT